MCPVFGMKLCGDSLHRVGSGPSLYTCLFSRTLVVFIPPTVHRVLFLLFITSESLTASLQ